MTPIDWTNLSKTTNNTFIQQTFVLPSIPSANDPGVLSVTSKSSSSKSCTLPSLTSTKHSRLSTPSLSSSDGKGKRPLSFSPLPETLIKSPLTTTELRPMAIIQQKPLAPLIEPNEIQCQWAGCDLLFSTPIQLTEHIRSVHIDRIDSRTWFCQWQSCSRHHQPFKSLYSLFTHLRTHTQDRPYQCSFIDCTKTFTRAEYLRLHERSHTGEKPYPCEYPDCSKAFSNPSDRTKHVKRTHLNKKEYICQIQGCHKSYTDPSSLRKHVKTVHGEDAFRQKKHKRTDDHQSDKRFEENKENNSNNTIAFNNFQSGNMSNNVFENNLNHDYADDDDEDIVVDQDMAYNVDVLGDNLGELSVSTAVHRIPMISSLKNLTKKNVLPAIHVTGVCDMNYEDESSMINQVAFRTNHCHRISAHSASTAYSSMRSDSMNVESALFLPSNHSSMISSAPHPPSASPYEYDCNVLQVPSPHSPLRRSQTTELSPTSSFCVSALSGDVRQSPIDANPKMAHLLYFLQSLENN